MIFIIIILAALVIFEFLIILRKRGISNSDLTNNIEDMYQGKFSDYRGTEKKVEPTTLKEKFLCSFKKIANFFEEFKNIAIRTERSSGRLSNQIQKTLLSSARISQHTEKNKDLANTLNSYVSEGSASIEEIHASIASLRDQIVVQNNKVGENRSSVETMNNNIQNISQIATQRLSDTNALVQLTAEGATKMQQTDKVIQQVKESVEDVLSLNTVINSIASKTNLLSMNAAIEAAHAGEAGKGFAVVAEEIRKLASMTANNAKNISETLKELDRTISMASELSSSSGKTFKDIEGGVNNVTNAFNDITDRTGRLKDDAGNVQHNIHELVRISEQTKNSITEMEIGAKDITDTFEKTTELAHSLTEAMNGLHFDSKEINYISTQLSKSFTDINKVLIQFINSIAKISAKETETSTLKNRMMFKGLILAHINWVAKARAIIDGTMTIEKANVLSPNNCELGKWLNSDKSKKMDTLKYENLVNSHNKIHDLVKEIADSITRGNTQKARDSYSKIEPISKEIVAILSTGDELKQMEWTPELSVGVKVFDEHHIVLFDIINKFAEAMSLGKSKDSLATTMKEIFDYTEWHFSAEEKIFDKYEYPKRDSHKRAHTAMLNKAKEILNDIQMGKEILSTEVLEFLQDWIVDHIMTIDKQYEEYLRDKEIIVQN